MEPEETTNISQYNLKRVLKSILIGAIVIVYLLVILLAFNKINHERLFEDLKIFAGTFLILGIVFIEQAYKQEDGFKAITGIEMLIISAHTLSMKHIMTLLQSDVTTYILNSVYVVAIYYFIKTIIAYTYGKKQYLDQFNDIAEIVKDEPIKKEAKKRNTPTNTTKTTKTKKMTATGSKKLSKKRNNKAKNTTKKANKKEVKK